MEVLQINPDKIDSAFPFDSSRTHQSDILHKAASALFGQSDIDVVVIDAPTGIGKSSYKVARRIFDDLEAGDITGD